MILPRARKVVHKSKESCRSDGQVQIRESESARETTTSARANLLKN